MKANLADFGSLGSDSLCNSPCENDNLQTKM